jgi:hypothetical protein
MGTLTAFNGVSVYGECAIDGSTVMITLISEEPVFLSGDDASDGTLKSLQEAGSGSRPNLIAFETANLDVIATANGTWSRFDIGAYNGGISEGKAKGCNFWGLITPGS